MPLNPSTPAPARRSSPGRPAGQFTQTQRLARLKSLLIKRPSGATRQEIAEHLNISTRSASRYLKQLDKELEVQKVDGPGRAVLWRLRPQQRLRKVDLSRSQAYALLAIRPMFAPLSGSALYEDIEVVYEKILDIAQRPFRGALGDIPPAQLDKRFLVMPEAPASYVDIAEEIDTFFWATAELHPVVAQRLTGGAPGDPIVIHPYALIVFQDIIWVAGAIQPQDDVHVIPLHELRYADLHAKKRFELPDSFDVLDYVDGGFGPTSQTGRIRVTIDFDPKVAPLVRLRPVHPTQKLSTLPDGAVRWTATVRDIEPVRRWVLGFGRSARVVEPDSLRSKVIDELRDALGMYRARTL